MNRVSGMTAFTEEIVAYELKIYETSLYCNSISIQYESTEGIDETVFRNSDSIQEKAKKDKLFNG